MSLHDDLLDQAWHLVPAAQGRGRPKQASLRRATSTAYYAVFHLFVDQASRELVSGTQEESLRLQVTRAFDHSDIADVCKGIAAGNPAQPIHGLLGTPIHDEVRRAAAAFQDLYQARHEADYDLSRQFRRTEAIDMIQRGQDAFDALGKLDKKDHQRRVFLTALAMHKRWNRR